MEWNYKQIKKKSWDTTFKKGKKSWFMLVVVAFLFAFIGASNGSQTTFIDTIDEYIGASDPLLPGNVDAVNSPLVVMARKTGYDHGETGMQMDGYLTAWFLWQLQGDEYAAKAFAGDAPELLSNPLYQDQRINLVAASDAG